MTSKSQQTTSDAPSLPSAASISSELRGFIEALVGQVVGECFNEMEARLGIKFDRLEARLTVSENESKGRHVDMILLNKRESEREVERLARVINRVEGFTQPPAGEQGERGPQGERGERGLAGEPGQPGVTGAEGPMGSQGVQGERGPQGARGEAGQAGAPGEIGPMGPQGIQGERGVQGARGEPGLNGEPGEIGPIGPQGVQGERGVPGPRGEAGQAGQPGEIGAGGPQGPQGERGSQGARGEPGAVGPQGLKGDAGDRGEKGEQGQEGAPGRLPVITEYEAKKVYYRGECVVFMGGCYQAFKDTGEPPIDRESWRLLAASGRDGDSPTVRGTYDRTEDYRALDIVMLNGSSFIARHDAAGDCPGEGWQVLALVGKRGEPGQPGAKGPRGERGERGERGANGVDGAPARDWVANRVDRDSYTIFPILSDRSEGPPLEFRPLLEQFLSETGG
jgi:hypothetical protein